MGGKLCCKRPDVKKSNVFNPAEISKYSGMDMKMPKYVALRKDEDQLIGLTKEEMQLLQKTWTDLESQNLILKVGAEVFFTLVAENPTLLVYFQYIDLTKTKPQVNTRLSSHALNFTVAIKGLLDNIDKPDTLTETLRKIVQSHLDLKITLEEFRDVFSIFVRLLRDNLAEKFPIETEKAWEHFVNCVIYFYMESGHKKMARILESKTRLTMRLPDVV